MSISKTEQYRHEHFTWNRLLDFFKQENAHLKIRLAAVLDGDINADFLQKAEHFQNQFIIIDQMIGRVKGKLADIEKLYDDDILYVNKEIENGEGANQDSLRNEMEYVEKYFTNLKNQFNKYLLSVL